MTKPPRPYRLIMLPLLHHLRCQVVQRPTQGGPTRRGGVHGPAKVCYLDVPLHADQQVLWLNVPVDHLLRVAVGQRVCQLSYILGRGREVKEGEREEGRKGRREDR